MVAINDFCWSAFFTKSALFLKFAPPGKKNSEAPDLDPRYKIFISEIDQIVATQHLQQTWDRLKLLQQELPSNLSGTDIDSSKTSNTDENLDILIKAREKAAEQNRQSFTSVIFTSNNAMQRNSIMVLLNSFANKPRLGKNENVLQYWEQFKESKRELRGILV